MKQLKIYVVLALAFFSALAYARLVERTEEVIVVTPAGNMICTIVYWSYFSDSNGAYIAGGAYSLGCTQP